MHHIMSIPIVQILIELDYISRNIHNQEITSKTGYCLWRLTLNMNFNSCNREETYRIMFWLCNRRDLIVCLEKYFKNYVFYPYIIQPKWTFITWEEKLMFQFHLGQWVIMLLLLYKSWPWTLVSHVLWKYIVHCAFKTLM